MKLIIGFLLWCLLLVVSWPVAILALLVLPVLWLLSIPFRVIAFLLEAVLSLLKAILFLPARLLGAR